MAEKKEIGKMQMKDLEQLGEGIIECSAAEDHVYVRPVMDIINGRFVERKQE